MKTKAITLSIGLKQFASKGAAQRWIDRKLEQKPCAVASKFVIIQLDEDCFEVEVILEGLHLPTSRHIEINLLGLV